jgi:hypothetical protein
VVPAPHDLDGARGGRHETSFMIGEPVYLRDPTADGDSGAHDGQVPSAESRLSWRPRRPGTKLYASTSWPGAAVVMQKGIQRLCRTSRLAAG